MLNDRLKVSKKGGVDVMLGRQTLLNCAGFHGYGDGCNGGEPLEVRYHCVDHCPTQTIWYPPNIKVVVLQRWSTWWSSLERSLLGVWVFLNFLNRGTASVLRLSFFLPVLKCVLACPQGEY